MDVPARPRHPPTRRESARFSDAQIRQEGSRFGATQVRGGSVFQGNFVGLTINSTAAARPDYAGQFAHSTLEPVKAYVPRNFLHDRIRTQLCNHAADESTKTLVVWGLGGTGKTQLVLDYVQQHRTEYKATFWIEAGRKESLERDFVHLYQTLFGLQMFVGTDTVSVDDAVTGVKSWFSGRQGPWLIVFDGADTIENEEADGYIDIRHFIPNVASLYVIVTSRSSTAKDMTRLDGVQVGEMEEAQAAELFHRYSRLPRDDPDIKDNVLAVVEELGYLALAVTLAATYVGTTPRLQSNIEAYLPEYRQRRHELLSQKPESLIHQYSESVLTTWETSYQAIAGRCPEAAILMTMLSFLSFDDIFLELFGIANGQTGSTELTEDKTDTSWRCIISPGQTLDMYKIEKSFGMLQKYSFVQWKTDQQSYAMHKLVHAWGYDKLAEEDQCKFSQATFGLVVEAVKSCGRAPKDRLRMVPHVMANFAGLTGAIGRSNGVTGELLNKLESVGVFITDLGRWPEVRMLQEFVLYERKWMLGEEHPSTISAMSNLASTLGDQGQLDEAAKMKKEVLEKSKRILGEEHPSTILAMNNLASTLGDQGQLDEAAKMKKEVLEKSKRILGEEHPSTISAMNNLANTLGDQGQLDKAAKMLKEVLEKRKQILGEEHPDTILAMNNLASTLGDQGQLDEAAKMKKEVLEKMKRILGEEHPDTISAMNNLANTLRDQGQLDEAAKMLKEVLEKRKQILSEEHPNTILTMNNLANTLGDQDQLDEAAKMLKEVLEKMKRILGEEHPHTTIAAQNLAVVVYRQNVQYNTGQASSSKKRSLLRFLRIKPRK